MNPRKESSSNAPPAASTPRARLPSDLFNCYKQYKANTDRLASWLGATAHLLGYSFPHSQPSSPGAHAPVSPQPSGRLKGKARKAAATGGSSNGDARQRSGLHKPLTNLINGNFSIELGDDDDDSMTTAAAALPPTLLNTNQFVDLARFITAKVDPPVAVPSCILGWARSAIKSRRLCADWFGADQSGDSAVKRSNQSHQFFITILEQVVDILATRVARTSQQSQQAVGIDTAFNRFAVLNVGDNEDADGDVDADADDDHWDTVDSLVDAAVSGQPGQGTEEPKDTHQRYCAKLRDEDTELALLDHLLTLYRTRLFIRETWQKYVNGECRLEVASMVTFAAVDKMQLAHDSLVESSPALMADLAPVLNKLALHVARGIVEKNGGEISAEQWIRDGVRPDDVSFDEETDILDLTFAGVSDMIAAVIKELRIRPVDPDAQITGPGEKPSNRADLMVWRGSVLACVYAHWKSSNGGGEHCDKSPASICAKLDALIASNSTVSCDPSSPLPKIPLPVQFAVLVFLDIRDLTRNHFRLVDRSLTEACQPHCYAIDQYLAHVAPGTSKTKHTRCMIKYAKDMSNPMLWWCKHDAYADDNADDDDHDEGDLRFAFRSFMLFDIFSSNHWLAGSFAVSCHLFNTGIGATVAQESQYVSGAAYLYWAIQHVGLAGDKEGMEDGANVPWSWPLMDELLALTRDGEGIYYGRWPTSMSDACRGLSIVLGSNPMDVSRVYRDWHKKGGKGKMSKPDPVYYSAKRLDLKKVPDKFAGGLWKTRQVLRPLVLRSMGVKLDAQQTEMWEKAVVRDMGGGDCSSGTAVDVSPSLATTFPVLAPGSTCDSGIKQRPRRRPLLSLEESLSQLRAQLTANLPALTVNVLLLHVQSYRILKHVRLRLKEYLGPNVGQDKSYFHQDEDLAIWAMFALHLLAAKDDTFFSREKGPKKIKRDWDMAMSVLGEIKELVQKIIEDSAEEYASVSKEPQNDEFEGDNEEDDDSDLESDASSAELADEREE